MGWWPATLDKLMRPWMGRFVRDCRAAVAVEFALVATVFLTCLFGAFAVVLVLFLRLELDFATSTAARQIMNGTVQKNSYTAASFRSQLVCINLPAVVFNCDDVIVNVQTATDAMNPGGYYTFVKSDLSGLVIPTLSNGASAYNVGVQGSYVYVQVIYPITFLPTMITTLISGGQTYNGNPAYLAISTAAFRNEQF